MAAARRRAIRYSGLAVQVLACFPLNQWVQLSAVSGRRRLCAHMASEPVSWSRYLCSQGLPEPSRRLTLGLAPPLSLVSEMSTSKIVLYINQRRGQGAVSYWLV